MPPKVFPLNEVWETSTVIPLLMMCYYPGLGSATDWMKQISNQ